MCTNSKQERLGCAHLYTYVNMHITFATQVRNLIQRQKIDMASEVIDAGRFDMTTTMDERKATLEAMLQV